MLGVRDKVDGKISIDQTATQPKGSTDEIDIEKELQDELEVRGSS